MAAETCSSCSTLPPDEHLQGAPETCRSHASTQGRTLCSATDGTRSLWRELLAPSAARVDLVPPHLSRGSASPSRCRCCRAPWEWGSRYRSPWSVCCSEQNSTCMHESMRTAVAKIAHKSSASGAMQQKAHFIRAGAERSTTI